MDALRSGWLATSFEHKYQLDRLIFSSRGGWDSTENELLLIVVAREKEELRRELFVAEEVEVSAE